MSRILNGVAGKKASPATQARVIEVAKTLGYRPNAAARALRLSRAGSVGFVVASLRNPVFAEVIRGAFSRARDAGLVVLLTEETTGTLQKSGFPDLIAEGRIDGLIIANAHVRTTRDFDEAVSQFTLPHVFVNRQSLGSGRNVTMDEEEAGRLAARHLLALGHRRIAHLGGQENLDTARRRTDGFLQVTREAGVDVDVVRSDYDERDAFEQVTTLLERRPTALFISNLNQAIGALARVRREEIAVPDELSIVSCDDDPFTEFLEVPLTVVRMPLRQLGIAAIDSIVGQLAGDQPRDVRITEPPHLIKRASSGPAPSNV